MKDRPYRHSESFRDRLSALADAYEPGVYALADGVCHVYYEAPNFCQQVRDDIRAALSGGLEDVATWMLRNGFATGHGDTIDDLMSHLIWQIEERTERQIRERHNTAHGIAPTQSA